jgi:beta-lactamase superfamily II metal-dependent hydrolase
VNKLFTQIIRREINSEMLKVHFLNVGHGDCTIIRHPDGRLTMIDINNAKDLDPTTAQELGMSGGRIASSNLYNISLIEDISLNTQGRRIARDSAIDATNLARFDRGYNIPLSNPIEFMRQQNYKHIFRYIQTHPDLDHMRGLAALRDAGYKITNFWDTMHLKQPEFFSQSDKENWEQYQFLRSGTDCKVLKLYRGSQKKFWSEDGLEILAPTSELIELANLKKNWNSLSYVLRLTYCGVRVIFGGDAEEDVWESIVKHYGNDLECDILKASHHGRQSGYYQEAVKLMNPQYTIVSVGKKPSTDAHKRYYHYSNKVLSTRWRGNITLEINSQGQGQIFTEYER